MSAQDRDQDRDPGGGYPDGARAVAVPDLFFSRDLAALADPLALRVLLWALWRIQRRAAGAPAAVRRADALADPTLDAAAAAVGIEADARPGAIGAALDGLVAAGRLLVVGGVAAVGANVGVGAGAGAGVGVGGDAAAGTGPTSAGGDEAEDAWLVVNDRAGRAERASIRSGRTALPDLPPPPPAPRAASEPDLASVVGLYEANIGLVTPMIAEELAQTAEEYPVAWVADAIREAVRHNARRWSYARAILERWARDGRPEDGDEGDRRGAGGARRRDRDGPYAAWIQH